MWDVGCGPPPTIIYSITHSLTHSLTHSHTPMLTHIHPYTHTNIPLFLLLRFRCVHFSLFFRECLESLRERSGHFLERVVRVQRLDLPSVLSGVYDPRTARLLEFLYVV